MQAPINASAGTLMKVLLTITQTSGVSVQIKYGPPVSSTGGTVLVSGGLGATATGWGFALVDVNVLSGNILWLNLVAETTSTTPTQAATWTLSFD